MAITIDKNNEGYFKGDKVRATGREDNTTYSFALFEFVFLEGNHIGEKIWQPQE